MKTKSKDLVARGVRLGCRKASDKRNIPRRAGTRQRTEGNIGVRVQAKDQGTMDNSMDKGVLFVVSLRL